MALHGVNRRHEGFIIEAFVAAVDTSMRPGFVTALAFTQDDELSGGVVLTLNQLVDLAVECGGMDEATAVDIANRWSFLVNVPAVS